MMRTLGLVTVGLWASLLGGCVAETSMGDPSAGSSDTVDNFTIEEPTIDWVESDTIDEQAEGSTKVLEKDANSRSIRFSGDLIAWKFGFLPHAFQIHVKAGNSLVDYVTTRYGLILYSITGPARDSDEVAAGRVRLRCAGRNLPYWSSDVYIDRDNRQIVDQKDGSKVSFSDCNLDEIGPTVENPTAPPLAAFVVPIADWTGLGGEYGFTIEAESE